MLSQRYHFKLIIVIKAKILLLECRPRYKQTIKATYVYCSLAVKIYGKYFKFNNGLLLCQYIPTFVSSCVQKIRLSKVVNKFFEKSANISQWYIRSLFIMKT